MKTKTQRGRGRPVDISTRLVLLEIARSQGVSENHARRLIKKRGIWYFFNYEGGRERFNKLRKWGTGPKAQEFLERQEECFREEYPEALEQRSLAAQINRILAA